MAHDAGTWLVTTPDGSHVYGPFLSKQKAAEALPETLTDDGWQVVPLEDGALLLDELEESLPVAALGRTLEERAQHTPQLADLIAHYGSLAEVPAPNNTVLGFATEEYERLSVSSEYWAQVHEGGGRFGLLGWMYGYFSPKGQVVQSLTKQTKADRAAAEQLMRRHLAAGARLEPAT